jgi:hypothetical protein
MYARENGLLDPQDGNIFSILQRMRKSLHIWLPKLSFLNPFIQLLSINMVMKFLGLMNKLNDLIRKMGTPYGETPQY